MKYFFNIFIVIFIGSNYSVNAQSSLKGTKFNNLTSKNGLSQNTVNCVIQDRKGILWFGTADGLNRYDGYHFKVYKAVLGDTNSLSNNYVLKLYEDKVGHIWIGTYGGGLNRFDPATEEFVRYQHDPKDSTSIGSNDVRDIYEDKQGKIWLGLYKGGLNCFDPATQKFTHHTFTTKQNVPNPGHTLTLMNEGEKGLWLGTTAGIFYFDKQTKKYTQHFYITKEKSLTGFNNSVYHIVRDRNKPEIFWLCSHVQGLIKFNTHTKEILERLQHDPKDETSINRNAVWSFYEDKNGTHWVGTSKGFHRYNPLTKQFIRIFHDPNNPQSITGNNVQRIFEDQAGTIWLCTFDGGISSFNPYLYNFQHYANFESQASNRVGAFCEDQEGNIWVGLGRGVAGLAKINRKKNLIQTFKPSSDNSNSIASRVVNSLLTDKDGSIWVGTIGKGLNHYNPKTGIFERFPVLPKDTTNTKLRSPHIGSLHQDQRDPNILWVGTRGGGLFKHNKTKKTFARYVQKTPINGTRLSHNTVIAILQDHKGALWIATRNGLNRFDTEVEIFTNYMHVAKDLSTLSNNYVTSLYLDKAHVLWIGTRNGLNKLDLNEVYRGNIKFHHYNIQQGLPNNVVHAIVEDKQGALWLSTNQGITCFDKKSRFRNYDEREGLQGNEFATGAGLLAVDGAILMGGMNGFTLFYPEKIKNNLYTPEVLITDFQIFNKSVSIGKESILKRPVWATDTIELSYKDEVISFEFAALNYILPDKNTYAIQMKNFDQDWRYIGKKRFETYTSLPAGTYVFRVKAANNDGVWSKKETQIVIIVHPPWWDTWWFRISVGILIITLLITGYRVRINRIKVQKRLLEKQVNDRTLDLQEANEELKQTNEELQTTLSQVKEKNLIIQEFNENIKESINYAQLIQQDMLPPLEEIHAYLPESFVFFRPRDIVSGDFYWFSAIAAERKQGTPQDKLPLEAVKVPTSKNVDKLVLVVGDCTGHGVPGAFMSIKGAVLLNQIVNFQGIVCPETILKELDNHVRDSLHQDKTNNRDGMDVGIVTIDFEQRQLEFAGAKNNLIYIKEGQLTEVKGNILPIGGYHLDYQRGFKKVVLPLEPHTSYYLSSDGYKDQFGGPFGKKFLKSRFKSMLLEVHNLPMKEQYKVIENTFVHWKKDYEQVDDVLIMGIHI